MIKVGSNSKCSVVSSNNDKLQAPNPISRFVSDAERLQLADQERAVIELRIGIFRVKFPDSLGDGEPRERLCKIDFPSLIRYVWRHLKLLSLFPAAGFQ